MLNRTFLLFLLSAVFDLSHSEVWRLPKNVRPLRYFLTMEPHLHNELFQSIPYNGSVVIEVEILENTKNITLHKYKIDIDQNSVIVTCKGEQIKPKTTSTNKDRQTYTINLEDELVKDEIYNLTIGSFNRNLDSGQGFFKAIYWKNNEPRLLAVTHFEPTDARRAFPCFDEPALKAKFIISLIRTQNYTSISNEELDTTEDLGDGRFKDTFKSTPIMSTYTVAFAVSDFKSTPTIDRITIFATSEEIENGKADQAMEISVKTLHALEEYMGMNYTLHKLDQFAVPTASYNHYAMENWGLVVYDGSQLLHNNASLAKEYKRSVSIIAHEFTHMWFGNLVTPEWWDYLWLSESFAAYFQLYIAGIVQPTWRMMDQFVVDRVQTALAEEDMLGAHPLNFPIKYSGEYPPTHIIYQKGSSILRMMEHFLTPKVFRKGLQIYLENNKFASTIPSDLYKALQQAIDEAGVNDLLNNVSIAEILDSWTNNKGFPVVTVKRNYATGSITFEQSSRFDDGTSTKWKIPINYVFSANDQMDFSKTTADFWLSQKSVTINNNFPTNGWVVINKQQTGYYRVNYDLENWERIIQFLKSDNFTLIHPLNRAQLISDAFNLASKTELPWELAWRLGEYLIRERDYVPLFAFYDSLIYFVNIKKSDQKFAYFTNYSLTNAVNSSTTEFDVYAEYLKSVLGGVYQELILKPKSADSHLDRLHRENFSYFRTIFLLE